MPWPYDAEVPPVQSGDLGGAQPLRRGDHRRVDGAERQITVFADKLCDAHRIGSVQRLDCEVPVGEVAEEADLGLPAEPRGDQVGDLGDDEGGDDEWAGVDLQQLQTGGVVGVVGVDVGVERPGVADQRDAGISAARISSIRSETSL